VRVISYNILADQNAFQTGNQMPFYPYCNKDILERARRLPLIVQELVAYQCGIMCLQEVDQIVFENLLQPILSSLGYDGYYTMKRHAGTREGCAVFWSRERFQMMEQNWFNLGDLSSKLYVRPTGSDWSSSLQTLERLLKSQKSLKYVIKSQLGHVVQILRLLDRQTQQQFLVVNTHLFYHPDASHIRLIQMLLISRQISLELEKDPEKKPHIILCGDFNSSLENAAGKLMVDRQVPTNFRDLKTHLNTFDFGVAKATSPPKTDYDFPSFALPESFPRLRSALLDPPAFTHCIAGFKATLDHILTTMECVGSAPMPSLEQVTENVAMPSDKLPSDHVSIVCDLKC
jgi:2',5'-phosphodiesterase